MKHLLLITLLFTTFSVFAQTMTYDQIHGSADRPKGDMTSYQAKNGEVFAIGSKIKIGLPSNPLFFNYVMIGDIALTGIQKASTSAAGDEVEIKKIEIWGNKRVGWFADIRTKGGIAGYSIDLENAIKSGEVITSVLSSDQALDALKKAKDKLDLGLITQMQYDSTKAALSKLIH